MARKTAPGKQTAKRPLSIQLFYVMYLSYIVVPLYFFIIYLSGTVTPIVFGTLSMAFAFLIVSFLFVWYFGLWQMKKWGLYFAMMMSFMVLIDWSTRFMLTETVSELRISAPFELLYHIMSILLIVTTFYVFTVHRKQFK